MITLNFYANSLDCLILFERNACFLDKLKRFTKLNPYFLSFIVFFVCNIINSPYLFYSFTREESEYIAAVNDPKPNFTYCQRNTFFLTIFGQVILMIVVIFRDIIILILQIYLSAASIVYFKDYLRFKRHAIMCFSITANNDISNENLRYITDMSETGLNKSEIFNSKLTKMTIYLVGCSTVLHLTLAFGYLVMIIFFSQNTLIANYFTIVCILIAFLKYISNFLFFYYFFKLFRQFLAKCVVSNFCSFCCHPILV
jgi:hypothetical protein